MPRASSIMGKCFNLSAPEPGTEAANASPSICAPAPVFSFGLSAYRMPDYTCWYVLRFYLLLLLLFIQKLY
jgi:hypothetical protein